MTMSRRQTNNTSYRCGSFENYAVAVHSPIGSPPAGDDDSDYLPSDVSLSSEDTPYRLNTNLRSISRQPHNVIEISSSEEEDSVHSLNDSTATGRPLDQVSKSNDDSLRVLPTSTRMEIFPENHPQAPPAASDYSTDRSPSPTFAETFKAAVDANPNISRSRYSTGNENTEDYDAALATPKRADETTRVETSADSASLIHRSTSSNIYDANAEQTSSVNGDTSCSEKSLWTPPPLSSSANIARQFSGFPRTPLDQVVGPYKNITDRKTSRKKKMQSFGRGEDLVSSYGHFEFLAAGGSKMVYQHDGNVLVIMKKTKEHMAELKTHLLLLQTLGCLVPKLRGVPRTWGNGPSTHWEHQKGHLLSHTGVDDDDSSGHKYIYQEMEYCNRNDLEDFLKAHHTRWESNEANLLVDEKKKIIYQVAFTCCFAMEEHAGFDHKDLKALNIFMHKNPSTGRTGDLRLVVLDTSAEESLPITVLKIPLHSGLTAKLGDFGTSKLDNLGSERAVEDDDFTTIENSPFWFLLRGNKAKTRGKCHDRFALGLLIFHVFYAFCPYQEIFEDDCPKDFKIYATEVLKTSSFEGLRSLTSNTEVYANTLWRQMVLLYDLAFTQDQLREVGGEQWKPVMNKLFSSRPKGLAKSFFDQVELYSIRKGSDPAIERTRRYLKQDGLDLLKELCSHREKCEMTLAEIVFKSAFMSSFHPTESVSEEEGDEAGTTLSFGIFNN